MEQKKQSKEPFKGIQTDMAPKQIQQHEWEPFNKIERCKHCLAAKFYQNGIVFYWQKGILYAQREEPACITRYQKQKDFEVMPDHLTSCQYCKIEVMASNLIGNDYGHFICRACYAKQNPEQEAGKV